MIFITATSTTFSKSSVILDDTYEAMLLTNIHNFCRNKRRIHYIKPVYYKVRRRQKTNKNTLKVKKYNETLLKE